MKTYVSLDNLEHVLKQIEDKRDEDLIKHPENKVIWEWATYNFETKIALEKAKIAENREKIFELAEEIKEVLKNSTSIHELKGGENE